MPCFICTCGEFSGGADGSPPSTPAGCTSDETAGGGKPTPARRPSPSGHHACEDSSRHGGETTSCRGEAPAGRVWEYDGDLATRLALRIGDVVLFTGGQFEGRRGTVVSAIGSFADVKFDLESLAVFGPMSSSAQFMRAMVPFPSTIHQ